MATQNGINVIKSLFMAKSKNKKYEKIITFRKMLEKFLINDGLGHLLEVDGIVTYDLDMNFLYVSLPLNCNSLCHRCITKLQELGGGEYYHNVDRIGKISLI